MCLCPCVHTLYTFWGNVEWDMEKLQTHPVAIADTNSFVLRLPSLQEPLEIGGQLVLVRSTGLRRRVEIQRLLVVEMIAGTNAVASHSFTALGGVLEAFWRVLGAPGLGWF